MGARDGAKFLRPADGFRQQDDRAALIVLDRERHVIFDAEHGLVFSSNGQDGTLTVIHEDDPDHYSVVATAITQKSARTMALDPMTHKIYLVAAEFGAVPEPSAGNAHPRAPVLDGSFKVLVVGARAPHN